MFLFVCELIYIVKPLNNFLLLNGFNKGLTKDVFSLVYIKS